MPASFSQLVEDALAGVQKQLIAEHDREVRELRKEAAGLQEELSGLRAAKRRPSEEVDSLKAEVARLERELTRLRAAGQPSGEAAGAQARAPAAAQAPPAEAASETPGPAPARRQRGGFSSRAAAQAPAQAPAQASASRARAAEARPQEQAPKAEPLESSPPPPGREPQPRSARAPAGAEEREAPGEADAEPQERLFEAQHGFAGAIFGEALHGSLGESGVSHLLEKLEKAVPPPPPNAAYRVGQKCEVIGTIMRKGESLESPKIMRLEPGTKVEVLEIGAGPTGKRIRVVAQNGISGWISVVSAEGVALLSPAEAGNGGGFIGDLIGSIAEDLPDKKSEEAGAGVESIDAILGKVDTDLAEERPRASAPKPKRKSAFDQHSKS
uniref:SH3 domain-containing protein n=1 Tax=Alexandrium monilatum TaxID=311494 RepID=A0A7S4SLL0_9DINO|mmetsp:Transcript_4046/g.12789  ORF Transcript_4046/g.12789 Transcript_4046/m.12789 type:complete len:384 (+) Transcript_4046:48-1199(+)